MKTLKGINHILRANKQCKELNKDLSLTLEKNPGLMIYYKLNVPFYVHGIYRVIDNNGVEQGNWTIKIPIPKNYPNEFPILIETSRKIKPSDDTHISENGMACTELDIICEAKARIGITITEFIDSYVFKYFCWQLLNANGEKDILESWRHKDDGRKDFFYEILETNNDKLVLQSLDIIKYRTMSGRNKPCFCNSGNKYKHCHEKAIEKLDLYGIKLIGKHRHLFVPK